MGDKRIDFSYGDLNPIFRDNVSKRLVGDVTIKPSSLLKDSIENVFKTDTLKPIGQFKGIVLRIEKDTLDVGGWLSSDSTIEPGDDGFIRLKIRVPELHPFPVPNDKDDHKIINLYPTFKAQSKNVDEPEVGHLVWVDFGNRDTQEDPVYIGPVLEGKVVLGTFGTKSVAKIVNERPKGTLKAKVDPPAGDKIGRTKTVTSSPPVKKNPNAPSYGRHLSDIDFNKVPDWLIDKWNPYNKPDDGTRWRPSAGSKSKKLFPMKRAPNANDNTDNQKWSIIVFAAAEVIERYWRQEIPGARVYITSHLRGFDSGNHKGPAIDYKILKKSGADITTLQVWSGLMKLCEAGNIPKGGRGLYLNVSKNGIRGLEPSEAGKGAASFAAAPGGSATPHYDFRGYYDFKRGTPNRKWLSLDLSGDGKDDIPGAYSSSELTKALDFLKGKNITIKNSESKKVYKNISNDLKGKTFSSMDIPGRDLSFLYTFYTKGWSTYPYSPGVGVNVPNLLEILGQTSNEENMAVNKTNSSGQKSDSTQVPKPKGS